MHHIGIQRFSPEALFYAVYFFQPLGEKLTKIGQVCGIIGAQVHAFEWLKRVILGVEGLWIPGFRDLRVRFCGEKKGFQSVERKSNFEITVGSLERMAASVS